MSSAGGHSSGCRTHENANKTTNSEHSAPAVFNLTLGGKDSTLRDKFPQVSCDASNDSSGWEAESNPGRLFKRFKPAAVGSAHDRFASPTHCLTNSEQVSSYAFIHVEENHLKTCIERGHFNHKDRISAVLSTSTCAHSKLTACTWKGWDFGGVSWPLFSYFRLLKTKVQVLLQLLKQSVDRRTAKTNLHLSHSYHHKELTAEMDKKTPTSNHSSLFCDLWNTSPFCTSEIQQSNLVNWSKD